MIRTIIIENEKPHSDYLTAMLAKEFPEIEVMAICDSVPEGIRQIHSLQPQLIFLDVELPPYTGFDLLEKTSSLNYEVIFTTSYNQYAAKAFRFCALDFIEKPFGLDELKEAISRYKNMAATGSKKNIEALLYNARQKDKTFQKVGIPILGGLDFIMVSEIIRCQSTNNYTDFYLTGRRKITATKTLKWVDDLLHDHHFFRAHDSHLINLNHIKRYMKGGEGGVVELSEGQEVDISRRRKEEFLKILSELKMISNK